MLQSLLEYHCAYYHSSIDLIKCLLCGSLLLRLLPEISPITKSAISRSTKAMQLEFLGLWETTQKALSLGPVSDLVARGSYLLLESFSLAR